MKSQKEVDEAIQKQSTHVEGKCTFPLVPATPETLESLKSGDWIIDSSNDLLHVTATWETGNIQACDGACHNYLVLRSDIKAIVKENSVRSSKHPALFFIDTEDPRFTAIVEIVTNDFLHITHYDITVYCNGFWQALYEDGTHSYTVRREEDILPYVRATIQMIEAKKRWMSVVCETALHMGA